MACSIIRACALEGEFYTAIDTTNGELVGYAAWMLSGHELFESEAQRELALNEFPKCLSEQCLSDAGKAFYKDAYLKQFRDFIDCCLGSVGSEIRSGSTSS